MIGKCTCIAQQLNMADLNLYGPVMHSFRICSHHKKTHQFHDLKPFLSFGANDAHNL